MLRPLLLLLLLSTAAAAPAETPLTAEEFEDRVTGLTLSFDRHGAPYGAEQYLPGRKVIWTFLDGVCKRGYWYEAAEKICFVYEDEPGPQCWDFLRTDQGFAARSVGDVPMNDLIVSGESRAPLHCPGPDVGV